MEHQGTKEPIDALRCTGCGRLWVSISARRMIRRNDGCLSCGEAVEPVLVDHDGVRPLPTDPCEGRARG